MHTAGVPLWAVFAYSRDKIDLLLSPPLPRVSLPPSPAATVTALGNARMTAWIFHVSQSSGVFILALGSCCRNDLLPKDYCWHPDCRSRWDRDTHCSAHALGVLRVEILKKNWLHLIKPPFMSSVCADHTSSSYVLEGRKTLHCLDPQGHAYD